MSIDCFGSQDSEYAVINSIDRGVPKVVLSGASW